jgi:hypothetical protein
MTKILMTILTSISISFFAQATPMNSLLCDVRTSTGEVRYKLKIKRTSATMSVIYIFDEVLNPVSWMNVESRLVEPIVSNDLSKMHNLAIFDQERNTNLHFAVSGRDIGGNPRLSAIYKNPRRTLKLGGCFAAQLP